MHCYFLSVFNLIGLVSFWMLAMNKKLVRSATTVHFFLKLLSWLFIVMTLSELKSYLLNYLNILLKLISCVTMWA